MTARRPENCRMSSAQRGVPPVVSSPLQPEPQAMNRLPAVLRSALFGERPQAGDALGAELVQGRQRRQLRQQDRRLQFEEPILDLQKLLNISATPIAEIDDERYHLQVKAAQAQVDQAEKAVAAIANSRHSAYYAISICT